MTLLEQFVAMHRPHVKGDLPGPGSAALLARQDSRESNARVYGRHFPIAVEAASGSFVRDVDGNVFIDFLTGAGVLSLGHGHPELVEVATEQLGRYCHGLDLPSPAKDSFTTAQLSMLPEGMRDRMRVHFCGPTGANAVDAALETTGGVTVGWRKVDAQLELRIDDEGPGLSNTSNLFVPFFTTKPGGSGIGLVLSRQIAEAHGGSLTLENRRGARGCQARLRLPL